jgi:hypothetical protein
MTESLSQRDEASPHMVLGALRPMGRTRYHCRKTQPPESLQRRAYRVDAAIRCTGRMATRRQYQEIEFIFILFLSNIKR